LPFLKRKEKRRRKPKAPKVLLGNLPRCAPSNAPSETPGESSSPKLFLKWLLTILVEMLKGRLLEYDFGR
jgi:hypothetical protein